MFAAHQIKVKLRNSAGANSTFLEGEPMHGTLQLSVPGKITFRRVAMEVQGEVIEIARNVTLQKSGTHDFSFRMTEALRVPARDEVVEKVEGYAQIYLHPDFGRFKMREDLARKSFKASGGYIHQLAVHYQVKIGTNGCYHVDEANFHWPARPLLPLLLLMGLGTMLSLLTGSYLLLAPVALLMLAVERAFTHQAYFAGLRLRVLSPAAGGPVLEAKLQNGVTKFLSGELNLTVQRTHTNRLINHTTVLANNRLHLSENYVRRGDTFRFPLPLPPPGLPGSFRVDTQPTIVVWTLHYRYARPLLADFHFQRVIRVTFWATE